MVKDMGKELKFGMMVQNMKDYGKMINLMDMEHFITQMEMYIRDIGKIIGLMEKEFI
jgi:hypothetical protein